MRQENETSEKKSGRKARKSGKREEITNMEEKTYVDDIDRSVYDIKDEEHDAFRIEEGLTPEIVDQISKEKHDPEWMREFRHL